MENKDYQPRIADRTLQKKLKTSGAVLITGPKWCGKTWTGLNASNSVIYLQDPDKRAGYVRMAQTMPSFLLRGAKPRLLDEWQTATVLWDAVRFEVDKTPAKGQFILTGSVVVDENDDALPDEKMEHTGTGRISRMRMRPMSLFESRESNGTVSLKELFEGKSEIAAMSELSIESLAYAICRGGWPAAVNMEKEDSLEVAKDYIEAVCERDATAVDKSQKDPDRVRAVLKSLARNVSTMTTDKTIMGDVKANDSMITDKTLEVYLRALRKLYILEDVKAWQPSLRSKTGIRKSNKRQFVDPSLAVAAIGASPTSILDDFKYFGFLFESLCVRDLRVYSEPLRGNIRHYHDYNNLEADIIIVLDDGRWAAVEVKLGSREIEEGAEHLKKLTANIDENSSTAPSFLMVLTGGEMAYKREDGVFVVPIGCLKD